MALNLLGYGLDHPVMAKGIAGLDRYTITETRHNDARTVTVRRLEACQSPVWDTVLTMTALADAGLAADDPSLARAARWVLGEEIQRPGRLAGAPAGDRRPAAGRSSSTTTTTPTPTTPPRWCWRCAGWRRETRPPSTGA